MRLRSSAHAQQAGQSVQQAKVKALGLLEAAQQYADQLQAAHGSQLSSMPDARKRKRTSSLAYSSNSSRFEEQLSMPGTPTQDLLPLLRGELRHHQLHGVKWLVSLYMAGLNGILADELDCDRRTQVIGLLSYFKSKGVCGPFLLACPPSTHPLWVSELHTMLGGSTVIHAHDGRPGSQDMLGHICHRQRGSASGIADTSGLAPPTVIVLTSPDVLLAQRELLARQSFKYIIVDSVPASPSTSPPSCRSSASGSVMVATSTRHVPASHTPGSASAHASITHAGSFTTATAVDTSGRSLLESSTSGDVSGIDFHSALLQYQQQQQAQVQAQEQQRLQLARQSSAASGSQVGHFQIPCTHALGQGQVYSQEALLDAMREIRVPSAGMLLLAGARIHEEEPLHVLWPLLSYALPDAVRPIQQAFLELQAAVADAPHAAQFAPQHSMAGRSTAGRPPPYPTAAHSQLQAQHGHAHQGAASCGGGECEGGEVMGEVVQQLRGVLGRFVLSRSAEEVDLAARRGRTTEVNLYDYFASAD